MATPDPNRPLLGHTVGLSAAQSEDVTDPGFHADELNRSIIRIVQRLLAAGARIVVGHDWRKGGIMETLLKSPAIEHAASIGRPGQWAIVNLVPYGREAAPLSAELEDYCKAGVLNVEQAGMPVWWEELKASLLPENFETALDAVSIMHLRKRMEVLCSARICIGGKTRGFSGFYPGVLEEGWRTAKSRKPLYVTSLLGGASRLIAQASSGEERHQTAEFENCFKPAVKRTFIYDMLETKLKEAKLELLPDRDLLPVLSDKNLLSRAGLTQAEWNLLIDAPTADAVGVMAIRGLAKLNRPGK